MNLYSIPRLYPDSFDWSRWRQGIIIWKEIGVSCRYWDILDKAVLLKKYAIGYLPGDLLFCRPKNNEWAVMFLINDEFCWTHFRNEEFKYVFKLR